MTTIFRSLYYPQLSEPFIFNGEEEHFTTVDPIEQLFAVRPDRSEIVACHNLASARAIAEGRAPNKVDEGASFTYPATPYQAPSGQFYVMIHTNHRDIRMDVANIGTARYYAKHGVDTGLAGSAYLSSFSQ